MEMIINTVRMVDFDQSKEYVLGDDKSLKTNLAIGFLNPEDFKKLSLTPHLNLKLLNENGEVIIKAKQNEDIPQGMILMPVSIWANMITGISNKQLIFKNIKVNAEATNENVLDIQSLLNIIKE